MHTMFKRISLSLEGASQINKYFSKTAEFKDLLRYVRFKKENVKTKWKILCNFQLFLYK